jgi:hypothetical protein
VSLAPRVWGVTRAWLERVVSHPWTSAVAGKLVDFLVESLVGGIRVAFYWALAFIPVALAWVLAYPLPRWWPRELTPPMPVGRVLPPDAGLPGWARPAPLGWAFLLALTITVALLVVLARRWRSSYRFKMDWRDTAMIAFAPLVLAFCARVLLWQSHLPSSDRLEPFWLVAFWAGVVLLPSYLVRWGLWDPVWEHHQWQQWLQAERSREYREQRALEDRETEVRRAQLERERNAQLEQERIAYLVKREVERLAQQQREAALAQVERRKKLAAKRKKGRAGKKGATDAVVDGGMEGRVLEKDDLEQEKRKAKKEDEREQEWAYIEPEF